jgi:hypothetical protein
MLRNQKLARTTILLLSVVFVLSSCQPRALVTNNVPVREFKIEKDKKTGFFHPSSEEEVAALVKYAKENNLQVRVRGAAHSVAKAIYTDHYNRDKTPEREINIVLDKMIKVSFDDAKKEATAQAGCHLGVDPTDPTSTLENSLFYQLDQHGWALPSTGGISEQTVGGFVSTGSAGGSTQFSFGDQIVKIRIVDGNGNILTLSETENRDKFYAAGVSMGLLGIITSVTFKCVDKFHIIGTETTTKVEDTKMDLFGLDEGSTKPSLRHFFENTEHARILWWPQKGVEKMAVWQARKMKNEDYEVAKTGTRENFKSQPYELFQKILGSPDPAQFLAKQYFELIADWIDHVDDPKLESLVSNVVNIFLPDGDKTQEFWNTWWRGLPMDAELNDELLPTEFTELWIPIEKTEEVMKKLQAHYRTNGLSATGPYALEIYAAKKSRFWMSPSYGQDCIRVDIFWFKNFKGNPAEVYYPQFWDLLKDFDFRLHWGKYLLKDPEYLKKQYPKWDDFMKIRAEMDPNQIFVTDYWRERLGIEPK